MDFWLVYWLIILPGFSKFFGFIGSIGFIIFMIGLVVLFVLSISIKSEKQPDEGEVICFNTLKWIAPIGTMICFSMILMAILIPSMAEMKLIIGGYYVTNIEGIADLPPNIINMINHFIEQMGPPASGG